jgi:hypothetical protein
MPLQATSGAASYDAFGGGAAAVPTFVEDVFSTYLYTGNGSTQTITNNINISGKGGMVWVKSRSLTYWHNLVDTVRGAQKSIFSNTTNAEVNVGAAGLSAFTSSGFSIGTEPDYNSPSDTYVSWTFRKQPKFFDVVTWTGTGSNTTISHGLGSVPACIMVKRTDTTGAWQVYHRSLANTEYLVLNATASAATGATRWNSTTPTSSVFSLGTDATVNDSGGTYVAYIFAHDAGGFGLTGTDNVISCGSFTTDGSSKATVSLGYEPQWLMYKTTNISNGWVMVDTMRGMGFGANNRLFANSDAVEGNYGDGTSIPTATGFDIDLSVAGGFFASQPFIYIAIRRGPMKVPTVGTSVFQPVTYAGNGGTQTISTGKTWPQDLLIGWDRNGSFNAGVASNSSPVIDRLRGFYTGSAGNAGPNLATYSTSSEASTTSGIEINQQFDYAVNYTSGNLNASGRNYVDYLFRRAPSFFDEVCYAGTGSATTVTHNLAAVPELIIVKSRNGGAENWRVYYGVNQSMALNTTAAGGTAGPVLWNDTAPTASVFSVGTSTNTNGSGYTYVAYLFATCAGVSKVGSYTGTGTTLQVDCGFTAGARFVLIKKTSGTGSWYVWDSARGIVSGNDPYLLLNSTAAEVTNTDYIDTYSAGFEISSTAPSEINENGGSFIFFAVA